ncbi:hypothetical protein J4457_04040 [Candidatus Woesearchaeota archaeon]|nr:hypothetical protein [Candidatus Woesearchaeota archaeon]
MLVNEKLIDQLKDLGLNAYEAKIWVALLSRGIATAGELSDISQVPRSRTYDVLESLERKGFIVMKLGKPIKYIAVKPEDVLERVKEKAEEEKLERIKEIEGLKTSEIVHDLTLLHKQGLEPTDVTDLTNAIKGRANIQSYINSLIRNAKKSVKVVSTTQAIAREFGGMRNALRNKKDLHVEFITEVPDKKTLAELQKIGKVVQKNSPSRFCVIDDSELLFYVVDEDTAPEYDRAIHVHSPMFAKAMEQMVRGPN